MYATKVHDYLAPYLPTQAVYGLSMAVFIVEKFVLPKVYALYAQASLDPKTLLPFVVSAIALYLSIVSIYHALRATARLAWLGVKWSVVIVAVWFVLGLANEMGSGSDGSRSRSMFSSTTGTPWWSPESWRRPGSGGALAMDPFQILFGQSLLSLFDHTSLFEPLWSVIYPTPDSRTPPASSSYSSSKPRGSSGHKKTTKTDPKDPEEGERPVFESARKLWVQNVRKPLEAIVNEAQSQAERRWNAGSKTQNR